MVINHQNSDAWKIHLTIGANFIYLKDAEEERVMRSNSGNIKFTPDSDADVIDKLFESLRSRDQENLERPMKGSNFILDSVQLMFCKCHEVSFIRGGSYIDSPDWIKKKKETINPSNTDDKCFQYAATVALNYGEIESHPEGVSNVKPFINKHNWINHPSKIDNWKTFEKNIPTIALNILYSKRNL